MDYHQGGVAGRMDCPFAYILVSLNNTGSQQSMTQLVGRVLRQPYVERTPFDELNESYVFCLRRKAADISREVKKALEQEGYEATRQVSLTGVQMMASPCRNARPDSGRIPPLLSGLRGQNLSPRAFVSSTEAVTKCWTTSDTCSVR